MLWWLAASLVFVKSAKVGEGSRLRPAEALQCCCHLPCTAHVPSGSCQNIFDGPMMYRRMPIMRALRSRTGETQSLASPGPASGSSPSSSSSMPLRQVAPMRSSFQFLGLNNWSNWSAEPAGRRQVLRLLELLLRRRQEGTQVRRPGRHYARCGPRARRLATAAGRTKQCMGRRASGPDPSLGRSSPTSSGRPASWSVGRTCCRPWRCLGTACRWCAPAGRMERRSQCTARTRWGRMGTTGRRC